MRPLTIAAVTLGLAVTLTVPAQAQTTTPTADGAKAVSAQLARPKHVKRVCVSEVAVKRHGQVIGLLHKGQTFKVIRKVYDDEFGFEVVGYYGFAYGDVNARGTVRVGAFDCH